MPEIFVGIGSNADAERQIAAAVAALRARFGATLCSHLYRSKDAAAAGADYLNAAARLTADEDVSHVSAALREIEAAAGRVRPALAGAPCALDLDLLLYGRCVDGALRVPRADVLARPFVLAPLVQIAPLLRHPVTGETLEAAWARMQTERGFEPPAQLP